MEPLLETSTGLIIVMAIITIFIAGTAVFATILLIPPLLLAMGISRYARGLERAVEQERAEEERIRKEGLRARAVVLRLRDLGAAGGDLKLDLLLKVTRTGERPHGARIAAAVPGIYLPQVQPGRSIPVFVDRVDPRRVVLDVEGLASIRPGGGEAVDECAFCGQVFPSGSATCPHCHAPVRGSG